MTILLSALVVLVCLLILGTLFATPLVNFLHQHRVVRSHEEEQLLLWVGMLLTAFMIGLLVMYLFLQR
jgi:uncharacterized membrane protein